MATTLTRNESSADWNTGSTPEMNGETTQQHSFCIPGSELWHESAPKRLISLWEKDADDQTRWQAWRDHLAKRKLPKFLLFIDNVSVAVGWGTEDQPWHETLRSTLAELPWTADTAGDIDQRLAAWMTQARSYEMTPVHALEYVAMAYRMPQLAAQTSSTLWWSLLAFLRDSAEEARQLRSDWEAAGDTVLAEQLLAGELPLVLATLFPEIAPIRPLRKLAAESLSQAIDELLDGEGLPHARHYHLLRPLFACCTRCRALGEQHKKGCWSEDADTQYEWLLRQAIRFSRTNGTAVLGPPVNSQWSPELFRLALDLVGDDSDAAAADAILPKRVVPEDFDFDENDLPDAAIDSEWSGLSVLATDWSRNTPRLTVSYGTLPVQIELECGRELLLSGIWSFETRIDGELLEPVDSEWEQQCWESDEDCDYLELSIELTGGVQIERQLLLSREDHVLWMADNIATERTSPVAISHRITLPLGPNVRFEGEQETRDGVLIGDKPRAVLLPLALPEWRSASETGELKATADGLELTQQAQGRRMCCPLFWDFKPRRMSKDRTWRQLTVAEQLEVQPRDVAVGFRAQSGKDQWLIYRSLAPASNRTVLGQNLSSEFFAGRFLRTGEVDEFLEIEAEED